jgi:hypothetical protein
MDSTTVAVTERNNPVVDEVTATQNVLPSQMQPSLIDTEQSPTVLGKRSLPLVQDQDDNVNPNANTGTDNCTASAVVETTEEAGLKLLFAASLLQEKDLTRIASLDESASSAPASSSRILIEKTTETDVLCGRGGLVNKHRGNVVYRRIVEYNKCVYKQVPKRHRNLVPQSIVETIINAGGRFLQPQQHSERAIWTEIPIGKAVQKTSQALRERIRENEDINQDTNSNENEDDGDPIFGGESEDDDVQARPSTTFFPAL